MAKKTKSNTPAASDCTTNASSNAIEGNAGSSAVSSPLAISRNKHWRYISAFHGPWLQLPHEILETLTHSNYLSPPPRHTESGILFDLIKVRKLVDDAADLAVRAQNGTAASALHAENSHPGAVLGLNARGGAGGNAKLSPERKYRMRELATSKLSQAYRLDEVAASVCMMQSASALETVAGYVLQRAPSNTDAKYVNFFHERIPSRMVAECSSFEPLNEIITREPSHAAPYRTRALLKIFKEDFQGAAQDLTEALTICRAEHAKHVNGKNQLISMKQAREEAEKRKIWTRDWMSENRVLEEDQPKGIELQLLFQRGNQYLTIASTHLRRALEAFKTAQRHKEGPLASFTAAANGEEVDLSDCNAHAGNQPEAYRRGLEARELVRKYAKRALRDYTSFFSHLDYAAATEAQPNGIFNDPRVVGEATSTRENGKAAFANGQNESQALVRRRQPLNRDLDRRLGRMSLSNETSFKIFPVSTIVSSTPPSNLPKFSPSSHDCIAYEPPVNSDVEATWHHHEMLTYHPLLPETLHSFLLTHCLLQTDATTLHRIANNVARLVRLADGRPFFLSARSPARADWAEILRQANNWISLTESWDHLCKSASPAEDNSNSTLSDANVSNKNYTSHASRNGHEVSPVQKSPETKREMITNQAVADALSDERVVDDESFGKAVRARTNRALREISPSSASSSVENTNKVATPDESSDELKTVSTLLSPHSSAEPFGRGRGANGSGSPVAKDEEYLIGTERAACIAKWVMEAPVNPTPLDGVGSKPKKKRKPPNKKDSLGQQSSDIRTLAEDTLAEDTLAEDTLAA